MLATLICTGCSSVQVIKNYDKTTNKQNIQSITLKKGKTTIDVTGTSDFNDPDYKHKPSVPWTTFSVSF